MANFARTNAALDSLLAVLAQREQSAIAAKERTSRREELSLELERMRENASIAREQIGVESKKADAEIKMQQLQMELAREQAKIGLISAQAQMETTKNSIILANAAERRAQQVHEDTIKRNSTEDAWRRVSRYWEVQDRISNDLLVNVPKIREEATKRKAQSEAGILAAFGTLTEAPIDPKNPAAGTKPVFIPNTMYEGLFEQLRKGDGKTKIDDLTIVRGWVEDINTIFSAKARTAISNENIRRRQNGQPEINSVDQIEDPVLKSGLVNSAITDFFMSSTGPVAEAAVIKLGKDWKGLVNDFGGNVGLAAKAAMTSFRFNGATSKFDHVSRDFGAAGTTNITGIATRTYSLYRGSLDDSVTGYSAAYSTLNTLPAREANLTENLARIQALSKGEEHAIMSGNMNGLSPEESRNLLGFLEPEIKQASAGGFAPYSPDGGEMDSVGWGDYFGEGSSATRGDHIGRFLDAGKGEKASEEALVQSQAYGLDRFTQKAIIRTLEAGRTPAPMVNWLVNGPGRFAVNAINWFQSKPPEEPFTPEEMSAGAAAGVIPSKLDLMRGLVTGASGGRMQ